MRATLVYVKKRNITLALPEDLLRKLKVLAAVRETSISALTLECLERLLHDADDYQEAMRKLSADMKRGLDLGFEDKIPFDRDSLHDRELGRKHGRRA